MRFFRLLPLLALLTAGAATVRAQEAPAYGASIRLEPARKLLAAAQAEARKNRWNMAVTIVDVGGHAVVMERMDDTQTGSIKFSELKARSAVLFRRPTKAFQDTLAAGGDGLRILKVEGAVPVEGGVPIVQAGKIIGAIGVSGGTPAQDGQVAAAGLASLKE
jgi:glc operon protein GlcG